MKFTYGDYLDLLDHVYQSGYSLVRFDEVNYTPGPKAIIRHDIDISTGLAVRMAEKEAIEGVSSTYFAMISSDFYNAFDRENRSNLREIRNYGHEVGLHFDISKYKYDTEDELKAYIKGELSILQHIIGDKVRSISWHIPPKDYVGKEIGFLRDDGIMNAYDPMFVNNYKYVSDSMMRWREDPYEYIDVDKCENLQILTHPVWYSDEGGKTSHEMLHEALYGRRVSCIRYLETILPGFSQKFE